MRQFDLLLKSDLEKICGGADEYRSVFDWKTYIIYLKNHTTVTRPPESNCVNYTPAYPGKVLPAC